MAMEVLSLMASSLEIFLKNCSADLPPVENNEAMHHCHVTLQTTNKTLQKCAAVFDSLLKDQEGRTKLEDTARRVLTCSNRLLRIDNFLLDCCCTAGMSLGLFVSLIQKSTAVHLILQCVFPQVSVKSQPVVPDWLELSGCCKLSDLDLSLTSHLCVCHGLVGVLEDGLLIEDYGEGKCLLIDVFLNELLNFTQSDLETSGKLLVAKELVVWTGRACGVLESSIRGGYSIESFLGPGPVAQKLLSYVWMTWEEPVDALRLNSRQIFENTVRLHLLASKTDPREDVFLQALVTSLLDISWSTKGKYGPLSCLVDHVGANQILRSHPGLPDSILGALREQALACYASELYEKLCITHLREVGGAAGGVWADHWVQPVLRVLCSSHKAHKLHVLEYVLPRLLKVNKDALSQMIHSLTSGEEVVCGNKLGALVMCLRRARAMGLLQGTAPPGDGTLMFGLIPSALLKQAVSSHNEQVRLDAFALLCDNNKTSQPIDPQEFELLQFFVRLNMNNQSPAFRQSVTSNLKKLFVRMGESLLAIRRKKTKSGDTDDVDHYKEFCHWLLVELFDNLFPGASFARTTTTLSVLSLLISTLATQFPAGQLVDLDRFVTPHHVCSLLECLTDTFEENKAEALNILGLLPHTVVSRQKNGWLSELLEVALKLSVSTKPQDCGTAAYLLRLVVAQEESTDLIQALVNKQTDHPTVMSKKNWGESSGFYVEENVFGVMKILLGSLVKQLEVAKGNLLRAAAAGPMYPTIHCIRYMLTDFSLSSPKDEAKWRKLLSELVCSCCQVARVVSPVVNNSSPEGNIPMEAINVPDLEFLSPNSDDNSGAVSSELTVALMPEYLVVCCWRSVKEVSLLLGELALNAPIIDPATAEDKGTESGLLTFQQIVCIGEYFIRQLLEAKHRGAFELAYTGFVTMMGMLWRNRLGVVRELPVNWLGQVMSDIQSEDGMSKLCATRRSAGVPFFIQAVLVTEPVVSGKRHFKQTMATLVQLALCPQTRNDSQVHALNILRALYRDARLGKDVSLYVADGVKVAILGFSSPDWAVRNSSTLLFSALMTRIFGVKRSKDETAMSKKNCLTGRVFFHRYPPLYPFLLTQLEETTRHIGLPGPLRLHPGLYPVLMLLGRLMPSVLEGGDTSLSLAVFIPHIIRCASSPVLKTRLMAARALQPLVFKDQVTSVLDGLLQQLPTTPGGHMTQSHIHGTLLQIRELLVSVEQLPASLKQSTTDAIHSRLLQSHWLLTRSNPCLVTRQTMLETVEKTLQALPLPSSGLRTLLDECLRTEVESPGWYSPHTPARAEFMASVASAYLQNSSSNFNSIVILLKSDLYEVRSVALGHLLVGLQKPRQETGVCKEGTHMIQLETTLDIKIINMILGEEWCTECLVKLFEVCALQPSIRRVLELQPDLLMKVAARVVSLATETKNADLKDSAINFIGSVLSLIYRMVNTKPVESQESYLLRSCVCLLRDCSQTEDSEQVKMAVVHALLINAEPLLLDPNRVLGPLTLTLWGVVFDLLQDDDIEVKGAMAFVLPHVEKTISDPVQPMLALEVLLGTMIRSHLACLPLSCLQLLLRLMVSRENIQQLGEERLFDKGEMNTYQEEITLARLVGQHLSKILTAWGASDGCQITAQSSLPLDQTVCNSFRNTDSGLSKEKSTTLLVNQMGSKFTPKTADSGGALEVSPVILDSPEIVPLECSEHVTVPEAVSLINTYVSDLSSQLNTILEKDCNKFTVAQIFLNTSEYQDRIAQISRLVTALRCLKSSALCTSLSAVDQLLRKAGEILHSASSNCLMAKLLYVKSLEV